MVFLGWLLSLFLGFFFYSTLTYLAGTWMWYMSGALLTFSGIAAVFLTFALFTARFD